MGGLFGYFGIEEWFYSLPKEVQEKIIEYGPGSDRYINSDEVSWTSNTATRLLANIALAALSYKDHALCDLLLEKAAECIREYTDDWAQYRAIEGRIAGEKEYLPDQREIDNYKLKALDVIRSQPGILQSDIKKIFPPEFGPTVGHALSQLKYEDKIRREKSGRSFKLFIK
jgi:hypothetical protein